MSTPKVFIIRHGETEWSLNGRYTGATDIPLTATGERRVTSTGQAIIGNDRLIVPKTVAHIYVSPRIRAQRTFELLNMEPEGKTLPWTRHGEPCASPAVPTSAGIEVTEDIREWEYGQYEGLTTAEIRKVRAEQGIQTYWNIWKDGCVGGESPEEVTHRLDRLIKDIKDRFQRAAMADASLPGDIIVIAHGHILRALAIRWLGKSLPDGPTFLMEAGGVGTLSYAHHNVDEPAIPLGSAFHVDP